jgi:hypothetical protein
LKPDLDKWDDVTLHEAGHDNKVHVNPCRAVMVPGVAAAEEDKEGRICIRMYSKEEE